MIDKKPFRVTNEQARAVKTYSRGEWITTNEGTVSMVDLAADLLDARELIDKQEALIKEMREEISIVVSTASSETTKSELSYISNYTEMRDLLKKSKDYA